MTEEKKEQFLHELYENDEIAFLENNVIVYIQRCEDGYDYSFFQNRNHFVENEDGLDFEEFDQSDFDDDLIDGGQMKTKSNLSILEYCIQEAKSLDGVLPSVEY